MYKRDVKNEIQSNSSEDIKEHIRQVRSKKFRKQKSRKIIQRQDFSDYWLIGATPTNESHVKIFLEFEKNKKYIFWNHKRTVNGLVLVMFKNNETELKDTLSKENVRFNIVSENVQE